jgi:hypothetical protein
MSGSNARSPFDPRIVAAVVVVGVIGFIAMWALVALGPQLAQGDNGQGHALSRSAPGYAGIVDLAERTDMWVDIRREIVEAMPLGEDEGSTLLVLTPKHDSDPEDIAALIKAHGREPVLLVLPKWRTGANQERKGWAGPGFTVPPPPQLIPVADFGGKAPVPDQMPLRTRVRTGFAATGPVRGAIVLGLGEWQTLRSGEGRVLLGLPGTEGALLLRSPERNLYILAEPDLINNFAFARRDGARAALSILDFVAEDADAGGVAFDVTLNGIGGGSGGFLKLAFVPPFIGITLCLIAAGMLALWQAAVRFGPVRTAPRAIPISKLALIESSAELVAQTQRESDAAVPWLRAQREALARALHAPPGLAGEALDQWLDRRRRQGDGETGFAALAAQLLRARTNDDMLGTARDLHAIRKDLLREH